MVPEAGERQHKNRSVVVFRKILLGLLLSAGFSGVVLAGGDDAVDVRVIGGTFKTLARGYVVTADIEKLKAGKIARIEHMRDDWFAEKYAELYEVIKGMPLKIRTRYGVTEHLTRAQAVRIIRGLDKGKLYEIIDNVPDRLIAEQFNEQLRRDEKGNGGSLQDKIGRMWGRAVAAISKGASRT